MPRDELVGDALGYILHREARVLLARDRRMEDHLKQQVTQLLAKMILVTALDGFDGFGGLLDQILHQ